MYVISLNPSFFHSKGSLEKKKTESWVIDVSTAVMQRDEISEVILQDCGKCNLVI